MSLNLSQFLVFTSLITFGISVMAEGPVRQSPQKRVEGLRSNVGQPRQLGRLLRLEDFQVGSTGRRANVSLDYYTERLAQVEPPPAGVIESNIQEWRRQVLQGIETDSSGALVMTDIHGNHLNGIGANGRLSSFVSTYVTFTEQALEPYRALVGPGQIASDNPLQAYSYLEEKLKEVSAQETELRRKMEYYKGNADQTKALRAQFETLLGKKRSLEAAVAKLGQYFEFLTTLEKQSKGLTLVLRAAYEDILSELKGQPYLKADIATKNRAIQYSVNSLSQHSSYDPAVMKTVQTIEPWQIDRRAARIDRSLMNGLRRVKNPLIFGAAAILTLGGVGAMASDKESSKTLPRQQQPAPYHDVNIQPDSSEGAPED